MVIEGQYLKDGAYILWSWSTLQEEQQATESTTEESLIENICLSCGETNVDEDTHQCEGRRVA